MVPLQAVRCVIERRLAARGARWPHVAAAVAVAALLLAGCASVAPPPGASPPNTGPPVAPVVRPGIPANVEPPPPPVNLAGFPLAYRQGYADGCASVRGAVQQDRARYAGDGNYRTGWQDGNALCSRK